MSEQNADLMIQFDRVRREVKDIAKKKGIDLSLIKIRNREAEKVQRRYLFYN